MRIIERTFGDPGEGARGAARGTARATPHEALHRGVREGFLARPAHGPDGDPGVGVLVLSGSSGRIEDERCRILAREGMAALSVRWFGGSGQPPGICEVPLETFGPAIEVLRAGGARRIGILGTSKGAEAALHLSVLLPGVDAVVALSPTSLTWANVGPGKDGQDRPYRSSWTWRGEPLPFVPYDDSWAPAPARPEGGPVAVRGWYEQSRSTFADRVDAARIPVERSGAELVLVAGGDDAMWPSLPCAQELAARREAAGRPVRVVSSPEAGHRPRLPGEGPAAASAQYRYGGSTAADAALGEAAWPQILDALRGPHGPVEDAAGGRRTGRSPASPTGPASGQDSSK
ncbi:acyl-CoA thioester hydrolase/BAAT C-terminal domain-containing protein [Streptomyces sp. NBC_00046]|uniref:acyl-CoA thioester hydrolase/BAAT C-terminal domain-containing protein n=1 Tax=Streptomyces sp. NBC_00046 TaxID=2975626 RepID=UPI00324324A3